MFNFIKEFINNRKFQVKITKATSSVKETQNGTPQGSIISPTLFILIMNDLTTAQDDVILSIFADDSATYLSGNDLDNLITKMQGTLDHIQNWCGKWGFKLSTSKTTAIIFRSSHRKKELTSKKKLILNGEDIQFGEEVKFLGVIFDKKIPGTATSITSKRK